MFYLVNAQAGSHLYGLNHSESDIDTMGIGVHSLREMVKLSPLDQLGDSDEVCYELRKYVRLAAKGNPTVLQMLWTPRDKWLMWHDEWPTIQQQLVKLLPSQLCRASFRGYLQQQKKKMLTDRGQRETLKEQFGFDTKFAMHAVRLGFQGLEVLQNGQTQLPMNLAHLSVCQQIRHGGWTEPDVIELIDSLDEALKTTDSCLTPEPDWDTIDEWLADTYRMFWR